MGFVYVYVREWYYEIDYGINRDGEKEVDLRKYLEDRMFRK